MKFIRSYSNVWGNGKDAQIDGIAEFRKALLAQSNCLRRRRTSKGQGAIAKTRFSLTGALSSETTTYKYNWLPSCLYYFSSIRE